MALNSGTRCGVCSRFFCCPRHRSDHQTKVHADVYSKEGQDFLVRFFQRKAEIILLKSQKNHATVDGDKNPDSTSSKDSLVNSKSNDGISAPKRRHDGTYKRRMGVSFAAPSGRTILVPSYRLRYSKILSYDSRSMIKDKSKPSDKRSLVLKTSTPIIKALSALNTWDKISPASTISDVPTPVNADKPPLRSQRPATPLRGIISKMSKYHSTSTGDSGSHSRRVTFNLSSQMSLSGTNSAASSGLGRIHEVEDKSDTTREEECHHNPYDSFQYVISSELLLQGSVREQYVNRGSLADSPPTQQVGFFSCLTSVFCSAIQTIPAFSNWRNANQKRRKRSRSPEPRAIEDTPHKKPCFDCDMRENPIKCRKPISSSNRV